MDYMLEKYKLAIEDILDEHYDSVTYVHGVR